MMPDQGCQESEKDVQTPAAALPPPLSLLYGDVHCHGAIRLFFFFLWHFSFSVQLQISVFTELCSHSEPHPKVNFIKFHSLCPKKSHYSLLFNKGALLQQSILVLD